MFSIATLELMSENCSSNLIFLTILDLVSENYSSNFVIILPVITFNSIVKFGLVLYNEFLSKVQVEPSINRTQDMI